MHFKDYFLQSRLPAHPATQADSERRTGILPIEELRRLVAEMID